MKELIKQYKADLRALNERLEKNRGQASELLIAGKIDMLEKVIKDLEKMESK